MDSSMADIRRFLSESRKLREKVCREFPELSLSGTKQTTRMRRRKSQSPRYQTRNQGRSHSPMYQSESDTDSTDTSDLHTYDNKVNNRIVDYKTDKKCNRIKNNNNILKNGFTRSSNIFSGVKIYSHRANRFKTGNSRGAFGYESSRSPTPHNRNRNRVTKSNRKTKAVTTPLTDHDSPALLDHDSPAPLDHDSPGPPSPADYRPAYRPAYRPHSSYPRRRSPIPSIDAILSRARCVCRSHRSCLGNRSCLGCLNVCKPACCPSSPCSLWEWLGYVCHWLGCVGQWLGCVCHWLGCVGQWLGCVGQWLGCVGHELLCYNPEVTCMVIVVVAVWFTVHVHQLLTDSRDSICSDDHFLSYLFHWPLCCRRCARSDRWLQGRR